LSLSSSDLGEIFLNVPYRVGASPERGNRTFFLNAMFSVFLEFQTMKCPDTSDSECYTSSSNSWFEWIQRTLYTSIIKACRKSSLSVPLLEMHIGRHSRGFLTQSHNDNLFQILLLSSPESSTNTRCENACSDVDYSSVLHFNISVI
jgi:hypothetical protein